MQVLKAGTRLRSAVSAAEIMVTKAPGEEVELCCGGVAMREMDDAETNAESDEPEGSIQMGKRYTNAEGTIELLCTKAGAGTLTLNGEELVIRGSKPLPSSD